MICNNADMSQRQWGVFVEQKIPMKRTIKCKKIGFKEKKFCEHSSLKGPMPLSWCSFWHRPTETKKKKRRKPVFFRKVASVCWKSVKKKNNNKYIHPGNFQLDRSQQALFEAHLELFSTQSSLSLALYSCVSKKQQLPKIHRYCLVSPIQKHPQSWSSVAVTLDWAPPPPRSKK